MMRRSISIVALLLLAAPLAAQGRGIEAQTRADASPIIDGERVALVIGNGAYESTAPLRNPVNDARDLGSALEQLGFEVIRAENQSLNEMKRAVREFGTRLASGAVGLFFFAGHGLQVDGVNYLIPVDAVIRSEEEVEYEGLDVGFVLAQMEAAGNALNVVILDACRNNPFERSFRSMAGAGLASVDAPTGTLIAYATAPGSVASDGNGRNGLYTQEILRHIATPGLAVEDVMKRVRVGVVRQSEGRQVPWESTSLVGDFYFEGAPATPEEAPVAQNFAAQQATAQAVSENARPDAVRVFPRLLNGPEVAQTLQTVYPRVYAEAGVSGTTTLLVFISTEGTVIRTQLGESSGYPVLDDLAVMVADVFRFSPATLDGERVPVWVELPIQFQVLQG